MSLIPRGGAMRAEVVTNTGLVRKNNEDSAFCGLERQIFIVADGMGGHVAGEVASKLAVDMVEQVVGSSGDGEPALVLSQAFDQANQKICQAASEDPDYAGMGTTLTVLWALEDRLFVAHVGDSRAYLVRDGVITPLTRDHSLVGELLREGGLTEEEAMVHPQRNILTRALGCDVQVKVDISDLQMEKGDKFFLCTDGLSNLVSSEEMADVINDNKNLKKALEILLNLSLERGGFDNITAILVENS